MRKLMFVVLVLLFAAGNAFASIEEQYQEGEITIQQAGAFDKEKHVKLRAGQKVTFKISVYEDEFFGNTIINANAHIDNATDQKVKAIYNISFHGKDGKLIGCRQGSWDLDANDDVNYGSCLVHIDPASIRLITRYKLRTQVLEVKKD